MLSNAFARHLGEVMVDFLIFFLLDAIVNWVTQVIFVKNHQESVLVMDSPFASMVNAN